MRLVLALWVGLVPMPCLAQSFSITAARWLTTPHVTDYRLSVGGRNMGPIRLAPFGHLTFQGPRADRAVLAGAGIEGQVRIGRGPYLGAGISAGFVDLANQFGVGLWRAWSVGGGWTLGALGPIAAAVEGRYQTLSRASVGGISFGLRLELVSGRSSGRGRGAAPVMADPASGRPSLATAAGAGRGASVVAVAVESMGTPYRWGGSDGNGFDCSGLIQYAYRAIGVAIPRTSAAQALAGSEVGRDLGRLAPGDILVFASTAGGPASHVGLYLGDGLFIHSATGGVQQSRLAPNDPRGQWWFDRWLGSRRILD